MGSTMGGAKPACSASAATASRSRTPQAGLRAQEIAVEGLVARRRVPPLALEGAVEEQDAARREHTRRAVDETDGSFPGRDVDHVAAEDDVGAGDGPGLGGGVERERGANVREPGSGRPGVGAGASARVRVARLKDHLRPARAGKVRGVLARAARHLEHQALRRQVALQHGPDRVSDAKS